MKLHEALRKVIRHFGVSVIEDKSLMSFLNDCRAFDECPAVKEVMHVIAAGSYGKRLCLAADESDDDCEQALADNFGRILIEKKDPVLREWLIHEKRVKEDILKGLDKGKNSDGMSESELPDRILQRRQEINDYIRLIELALERMD